MIRELLKLEYLEYYGFIMLICFSICCVLIGSKYSLHVDKWWWGFSIIISSLILSIVWPITSITFIIIKSIKYFRKWKIERQERLYMKKVLEEKIDKEQRKEIYERKNCAYCGWLKSALHWWCTNEEACKARGTNIPGVCKCPWWKPDEEYIREHIKEQVKKIEV